MVKQISANRVSWFDLEDNRDRARLENPMLTSGDLDGYIVSGKMRNVPGIFEIIRVLADQRKGPKFLSLGSVESA